LWCYERKTSSDSSNNTVAVKELEKLRLENILNKIEVQVQSMNTFFRAPWGKSLKIMTGLSVLVLAALPVIGIATGPEDSLIWAFFMIGMPLSMIFIASLFTVRGYVLTSEALLVRRVFWNSRIELSGLLSAEVDADAMTQSIRTFGNGGMFCFAGAFSNKKLGSYRAFATDPKRSVVLRFPKRTIVVTPDRPEVFVERVRELILQN
jgi:hypothetical protein